MNYLLFSLLLFISIFNITPFILYRNINNLVKYYILKIKFIIITSLMKPLL